MKLGPEHGFKECLIHDRKFPQNDTIIGKTENFQVFQHFQAVFVDFLNYFLA